MSARRWKIWEWKMWLDFSSLRHYLCGMDFNICKSFFPCFSANFQKTRHHTDGKMLKREHILYLKTIHARNALSMSCSCVCVAVSVRCLFIGWFFLYEYRMNAHRRHHWNETIHMYELIPNAIPVKIKHLGQTLFFLSKSFPSSKFSTHATFKWQKN